MANETLNILTTTLNQDTLITEKVVKVLTPISSNKATGTITAHIITAQDMKICNEIGQTTFDNLIAEYKANNRDGSALPDGKTTGTPPIISGDTTDYKGIYAKVIKPLAWWAYSMSIKTTAFNPTEQGIIKRGTEDSDPADLEDVKSLIADAMATARGYTKMLKEYIEELKDETIEDEKTEQNAAANMSIFVPKKPWHGKKNY